MFIRLLIYVVIGVLIYRGVKKWFAGSSASQRVQHADKTQLRADDVMIQDPQCGVYFAKRDGVSLMEDGQKLYFCSETCKEKYLADRKGDH